MSLAGFAARGGITPFPCSVVPIICKGVAYNAIHFSWLIHSNKKPFYIHELLRKTKNEHIGLTPSPNMFWVEMLHFAYK